MNYGSFNSFHIKIEIRYLMKLNLKRIQEHFFGIINRSIGKVVISTTSKLYFMGGLILPSSEAMNIFERRPEILNSVFKLYFPVLKILPPSRRLKQKK